MKSNSGLLEFQKTSFFQITMSNSSEIIIQEAIRNKTLIEFYYDGGDRVVEPHCLGKAKSGKILFRGYQVSGYSQTRSLGWKLFDLSKVNNLVASSIIFAKPRDGYVKGDSAMVTIIAEL